MIRESQWARLREFQWLIIAVVVCVTVVAVILVLRPKPIAPDPWQGIVEHDRRAEIACLEGGGTWVAGGHCSHISYP